MSTIKTYNLFSNVAESDGNAVGASESFFGFGKPVFLRKTNPGGATTVIRQRRATSSSSNAWSEIGVRSARQSEHIAMFLVSGFEYQFYILSPGTDRVDCSMRAFRSSNNVEISESDLDIGWPSTSNGGGGSGDVTNVTEVSSDEVRYVTAQDFPGSVANTETPAPVQFIAMLPTLPDHEDVRTLIYSSPLGRRFPVPISYTPNDIAVAAVPEAVGHVYSGPLTTEQYATFSADTVIKVLEANTIRLKRINSVGSPINLTTESSGVGVVNTSGVTPTDLATAISNSQDTLRAEFQAAISNEQLARQSAINANPDGTYTELYKSSENAPAVGSIPTELTSLPADQQQAGDVAAIVYKDFRVFYEAGPWTEQDRLPVAQPQSQLPRIGGPGNSATFGYWKSPDSGNEYAFVVNFDNANYDTTKNVTDSDGPDHFSWLGHSIIYPYEQQIAHHYRFGGQYNTTVLIGRKMFYFVGDAAQRLVQPVDNTNVGTSIAGWEYSGNR